MTSFWRSSQNQRSDKPETFYCLSHNLNEETMRCQKDLACCNSKNLMINFSVKENATVESKSKNDSGILDESQK